MIKTVWFLVLFGWPRGGMVDTNGGVIIPVPYNSEEQCQLAAKEAFRADKPDPLQKYVWTFCVPSDEKRP